MNCSNFVDLADRQNDRIDTFSGGMKRRVNIAAGLLNSPPLVYMDEPTVGIDPQNRRRVLDTVKLLRDEHNMTVLYTTHLMEEAQELSDRGGHHGSWGNHRHGNARRTDAAGGRRGPAGVHNRGAGNC